MKKSDAVFEANPDLKSYHKTSDGECFYEESDANNHARSLKNKFVKEVYNENLIDVTAEVVTAEEIEGTAPAAAEETSALGSVDTVSETAPSEAAAPAETGKQT